MKIGRARARALYDSRFLRKVPGLAFASDDFVESTN